MERSDSNTGAQAGKAGDDLRFLQTRRLNQIAIALFMHHTRDIGVTPVQYAILRVITARPGIDQRSVASHAVLDASTTANVLSRMEKRGWLTRTVRPDDRRMLLVNITDEGRALLDQIEPYSRAYMKELLSPLTPQEQETLLSSIEKLLAASEGTGAPKPWSRASRAAREDED